MQNIVGSSPARGSSSFSLGKKELSSGIVACTCLVSITDYSCTCTYMYSQPRMYMYTCKLFLFLFLEVLCVHEKSHIHFISTIKEEKKC